MAQGHRQTELPAGDVSRGIEASSSTTWRRRRWGRCCCRSCGRRISSSITRRRRCRRPTLLLHHAILHRALKKAAKDRLIPFNLAADLDGKPRKRREDASENAQAHAWSASEARAFLMAAKAAGPQPAAFYALALDSGARKGELCGLAWTALDLEAGQDAGGPAAPRAGPVAHLRADEDRPAADDRLGADTVALLRAHKAHQAEVKMANRTALPGPRPRLREGIRRPADPSRVSRSSAANQQRRAARLPDG